MKIQSVKLACFSPTGTSKSIIKAVAQGLGREDAKLVDITEAAQRKKPLNISRDELLVVAVPVYAGRVPVLVSGWLNTLKADQAPAVCVVVYGNREYEDALLELGDIIKKQGGVPLAGAAFIGEHSFSSDDTPIAVGPPGPKRSGTGKGFRPQGGLKK